MNVCIPVTEDKGLESPICAHFGSTPLFLVVEKETGACRAIPNGNQHHAHGACQPLRALAGESIDAIIVGGIGMGAIAKLQAGGMRVFIARGGTVEDALKDFDNGSLVEASPETACAHHGQHAGHAHDHGAGPARM